MTEPLEMAGQPRVTSHPVLHAPYPQWPYWAEAPEVTAPTSIPRGVDEAALRRCLVTEA